MMTRSRAWIVAALFAIVSFSIPFLVITALAERHPEIRLIQTGNHISALIVDGNSRVLVINSNDRGGTRSAQGRLARPWEPDISTVIAPATEQATPGLWEAFQHPAIRQIIITGLPGSDPVWSSLESEARARDLDLTYAGEPISLTSKNLNIEIYPGESSQHAFIQVARGESVLIMTLGTSAPEEPAHALVTSRMPQDASMVPLVVVPATSASEVVPGTLLMSRNTLVTLVLEEDRIRVQGGRLIPGDDPAS